MIIKRDVNCLINPNVNHIILYLMINLKIRVRIIIENECWLSYYWFILSSSIELSNFPSFEDADDIEKSKNFTAAIYYHYTKRYF